MSKQPKVIYKDQQDTGMIILDVIISKKYIAQAFKAEDAIVRANYLGSHAITIALQSLLKHGDD